MNILTFSSLYPNLVQPIHGIFVENRLRQLIAYGGVTSRVVAPRPWFFSGRPVFGSYAKYAQIPRREIRQGVVVEHPAYLVFPKISMTTQPFSMYLSARLAVKRILASGFDFKLIDAHYFYPDGIAAVLLGREFGRPVCITARGTDINVYPNYRLPRRLILWAARRAAALVTVSEGLKDNLVRLGIPGNRINVLRNGVDLGLFRPRDRAAARARLNLKGTTLLSVGNLVPAKGHELLIRAAVSLPDARVLIVGQGPQADSLRALARQLNVADRVSLLGALPHEELPEIYSASDVLVLASEREGWPNVLLEAMACGTPVVSTAVSGATELITCREAGLLLRERTPESVVGCVRALLTAPSERRLTRAHAENFSWERTSRGQLEVFTGILDASRARAPGMRREELSY